MCGPLESFTDFPFLVGRRSHPAEQRVSPSYLNHPLRSGPPLTLHMTTLDHAKRAQPASGTGGGRLRTIYHLQGYPPALSLHPLRPPCDPCLIGVLRSALRQTNVSLPSIFSAQLRNWIQTIPSPGECYRLGDHNARSGAPGVENLSLAQQVRLGFSQGRWFPQMGLKYREKVPISFKAAALRAF